MRAGPSVGLPFAFGDLLLEDTDHTGEFPGVFRVGGRENFMGLENVSGTVLEADGVPALVGLQGGADLIRLSPPRSGR